MNISPEEKASTNQKADVIRTPERVYYVQTKKQKPLETTQYTLKV